MRRSSTCLGILGEFDITASLVQRSTPENRSNRSLGESNCRPVRCARQLLAVISAHCPLCGCATVEVVLWSRGPCSDEDRIGLAEMLAKCRDNVGYDGPNAPLLAVELPRREPTDAPAGKTNERAALLPFRESLPADIEQTTHMCRVDALADRRIPRRGGNRPLGSFTPNTLRSFIADVKCARSFGQSCERRHEALSHNYQWQLPSGRSVHSRGQTLSQRICERFIAGCCWHVVPRHVSKPTIAAGRLSSTRQPVNASTTLRATTLFQGWIEDNAAHCGNQVVIAGQRIATARQ